MLIDECVVRYVGDALHDLGADVLLVWKVARGIDDVQVLQLSLDEQRILITEDYGFGELVFRIRKSAVGVVLIASGTIDKDLRQDSRDVARRIMDQASALTDMFTIVEAERIRRRPLARQ